MEKIHTDKISKDFSEISEIMKLIRNESTTLTSDISQKMQTAKSAIKSVQDTSSGLAKTLDNTVSKALASAFQKSEKLDNVIMNAGLSLSKNVVRSALRPVNTMISDGLSNVMGNTATGNAVSGTLSKTISGLFQNISLFAKGGVVSQPTMFSFGGNTESPHVGMAGEAGSEAILPLSRGADGRLGVRQNTDISARSVQPVIVNIHARDAESFRQSQTQIAASFLRMVGKGKKII
jgi:hypothetical protein